MKILFLSIVLLALNGCIYTKNIIIDPSDLLAADIAEVSYSKEVISDLLSECKCCTVLDCKAEDLCEGDTIRVKLENLIALGKTSLWDALYLEVGFLEGNTIKPIKSYQTNWIHPNPYYKNMRDQYELIENGKKLPYKAIVLDRIALKDAKIKKKLGAMGDYINLTSKKRNGEKIEYFFVMITAKNHINKYGKQTYMPLEIWIPSCINKPKPLELEPSI